MGERVSPAVPERVRWVVDLLDPGPAEHILEVGPGPGVAACLVCARLGTGRLLAVDRSAVAVRRTVHRNAEHVAAGRLEVRLGGLHELELPADSFDAAFSINVNLFWTGPASAELAVLRRALRPGGRLLVCFGGGSPQSSQRIVTAVSTALATAGFTAVAPVESAAGLAVTGHNGATAR